RTRTGTATRRRILFCGASRRIPFRTVSLLLKLRTNDKRLREILRIIDDRGDQQHVAAARERCDIEVFRSDSILAIRNAILAQISGAQVGSGYLERRSLPLRVRITLPCPLTPRPRR